MTSRDELIERLARVEQKLDDLLASRAVKYDWLKQGVQWALMIVIALKVFG